jgi:hypothetical protein
MRHRHGARHPSVLPAKPLAARPREHVRAFVPPALIDVEIDDAPPEQEERASPSPALWLVSPPDSASEPSP